MDTHEVVSLPSLAAPLDERSLNALRWSGTCLIIGLLSVGALGWLPFPGVGVALGLAVASAVLNAAAVQLPRAFAPAVLVGDVVVLTAFFATTGGISNPFTLLYLMPVLLAALVLSPMWTAGIAGLTTLCFGSLYVVSPEHHHMEMSQHLLGMLAAYAITVPVLAAGVHRLRSATHAAQLAQERALQAQQSSQRVAALAALAGGAAHELATPLSNILLVARELESTATAEQRPDLQLISEQVLVCREIVSALAFDAGGLGVPWSEVVLDGFVAEALHALDGVQLDVPAVPVWIPSHLVSSALRRLVGNALDAGARRVHVTATVSERLRLVVQDDGEGMSADILRHAIDPFFTTKANGQGRGLGLFFVHTMATQLGGTLVLLSTPGEGTTAVLELPLQENRP